MSPLPGLEPKESCAGDSGSESCDRDEDGAAHSTPMISEIQQTDRVVRDWYDRIPELTTAGAWVPSTQLSRQD